MPQKAATPSKQYKPKPKTPKVSNDRPKAVEDQVSSQGSRRPLSNGDQQSILSHFAEALSITSLSQAGLQSTIQSVKAALYARDFTTAFGDEDFRQAYSARWSPSRSLGYAQLLLEEALALDARDAENWDVVCLGGGAGAELVGLTKAWDLLQQPSAQHKRLNLHMVDVADWTALLQDLARGLPGRISEDHEVKFDFNQMDLLAKDAGEKLRSLLGRTDLVTIFFTLNELYAASLAKTTQFLLELGDMMRPGARLCVVDSAGSYAGVVLDQDYDEDRKGEEESQTSGKRYPMAWMLDHTLLKLSEKNKERRVWRKLVKDESRWFRRDKTLEYPLPLEDMRYQVHMFEKLDDRMDE